VERRAQVKRSRLLAVVPAIVAVVVLVSCASARLNLGQKGQGTASGSTGSAWTEAAITTATTSLSADQLVTQAKSRLAATLGLEVPMIVTAPTTDLPAGGAATTMLKWPGGEGWLDGARRIVFVVRDGRPTDPTTTSLDATQLEADVLRVLELLGWDAAALAEEGLRADQSTFTNQYVTLEFVQTWIAYTSQDIQNGGRIDLRLDASDGSLNAFMYYPGVREPVDLSRAITRDEAVVIARARVLSRYPSATLALESATLKVTNAPGVTGGKTMLVWAVVFTGNGPSGIAAGGRVYIDANTGDILQYLVPVGS
jgi:hypothetical protein